MNDKNDTGTVMFASASIVTPVFAWGSSIFWRFIIVPHGLDAPWFVLPLIVTLASSYMWAWSFVAGIVDKMWTESKRKSTATKQ